MDLRQVTGTVFNVQSYCIHDGPGIRSTVFLKGCPLHCRWCQNPESQAAVPELMFYRDRCKQCGICATLCPQSAISGHAGQTPVTDRTRCIACGACALCPAKAREIAGSVKTAGEIVDQLLADKLFFDGSDGGITISGGEPLYQPEFTSAVLALAQQAGVHTAIETCNFASQSIVDQVYSHVNLGLCDVKHMDSETHRRITGVPNEQILSNIKHIWHDLKTPVVIRTPVVPGYNGDSGSIAAIARFITEDLSPTVPLHLLPYHRLGESKGESLELPENAYLLHIDPPTSEEMDALAQLARSIGVETVHIGG